MAINRYLWEGQTLLIATKHRKEQVLGPLFEASFGLIPVVPCHFDTDQWGTFSGEIPRIDSPTDALRKKAHEAARLYPEHVFILVSEGSFCPHPTIPFIMADDEFLLFYNQKTKQEIIQRHLSTKTNFNAFNCNDWSQLETFARGVHFPSLALIL
ncbi:MAG: hypothetical protein FGM54_03725, partial [Chitinophagaceae bacterium]|nr:hypothetical protein [Chitinophagaceae bacterium]